MLLVRFVAHRAQERKGSEDMRTPVRRIKVIPHSSIADMCQQYEHRRETILSVINAPLQTVREDETGAYVRDDATGMTIKLPCSAAEYARRRIAEGEVEILDVMSGDEEKPLTLEDFQALGEDLGYAHRWQQAADAATETAHKRGIKSGCGYVYGRNGKTYIRLPDGSEIEVDSRADP